MIYISKSVKPSNFDCPSQLQNSIKLDVDKYMTTRILFCRCLPHLLSYFNLCLSLSSVICLSYFTHDFLTVCPVAILRFAIQLTFCIPYQMLLTTLIWKHMYLYISENNFGPSNQIIVPTGYTVYNQENKAKQEIEIFLYCTKFCNNVYY